ncbi:transposase [Roseomonas terrae]|uniref:Transposase n=1 Tax=Neoroseomonas terrae TaxID=424799 RepID=A0ABS5ECB6_9PROT|nr:transposase [Neoroseomonas terrae]MBR0648653.1 transposase [Neoroseomonas terrae]
MSARRPIAINCPPLSTSIRSAKRAAAFRSCSATITTNPDGCARSRTNPTRRNPHPFDESRYGARNVVERMFCRFKEFCRIATRYGKLARNFASAVVLIAAIIWWT